MIHSIFCVEYISTALHQVAIKSKAPEESKGLSEHEMTEIPTNCALPKKSLYL